MDADVSVDGEEGMSDEQKALKVKPLFLVKPKTIGAEDIKRAEDATGICIIECSEPEAARFVEPPVMADMDAQARAAISLMRYIVDNTQGYSSTFYGSMLIKHFVDILMYSPKPQSVAKVKK